MDAPLIFRPEVGLTAAFVRKLERYVRFSHEEKATLIRIGSERIKRFEAREDVLHEGDKPEAVNLIQQGWACRYKTLEDGRRQIIAFFLPGDLCDLNVFVLDEMDHSIGTITALQLAEIPRRSFEEIMSLHPRIAQALWWESLVAAAIQREWTVNLGQRDAFERTAHLMCELFLRLEAAGLTEGNTCEFPLTQVELGDATGLSSVHVNRTLQELRAADLIVLKDRSLTILDVAALHRAAMFNPNYLHLGHEGRHLDANDP